MMEGANVKFKAYLESGIASKAVADIFEQHAAEFDVEIENRTVTFSDDTGMFFTGRARVQLVANPLGTYGRVIFNEGVIINIWTDEHVPISSNILMDASFDAELNARKEETTRRIIDKISADLDDYSCGEEICAEHIEIIEATYYSDDETIGYRPYWSCLVKDRRTGNVRYVSSWSELKEFIRSTL